MDPFTLLMAARAAVTFIKQGCEMLREGQAIVEEFKGDAEGIVKQFTSTADTVKGLIPWATTLWDKLLGAFKVVGPRTPAIKAEVAKSQPTKKPVAKKKEAYVAVDEAQVMADIVTQLSTFFKLQAQLADHIREEEEKSKNVYNPDANLMEAALKRVMAQDQMALLETEIREAMVYGAPKEMGALYSKVFEMRDVIKVEQDKARKKRDDESWQRKEEERLLRERQTYLLVTFLCLLYLWLLIGVLSRIGK